MIPSDKTSWKNKSRKLIQAFWSHRTLTPTFLLAGIFFSAVFSRFLIPIFLKIALVQSLFTIKSFSFIVLPIFMLILVLAYNPVSDFWRRYKNNHKLKKPPITYFDGTIIFVIIFSFSLPLFTIFIFPQEIFENIIPVPLFIFLVLGIFTVLWLLCIFCFRITILRKNGRIEKNIDEGGLLGWADDPITRKEQDCLNRVSFVDSLCKRIIKLPFPDSFVFGLYGGWGEGKTSVLRLLRNELVKDEEVVLVEFDPWYFENQKALLGNFYQSIEFAINKIYFFPHLKRMFHKYQNILTAGFKHFSIDLTFPGKDESLVEMKNRIELDIQKTEKKIVVFIDDIDRLQPDEMLLVFKLVKLSANFKNTIFVLSFDIKVIKRTFKNQIKKDAAFIDKVIQEPIHLPKIEQSDIDSFLFWPEPNSGHKSQIDKIFEELRIDKEKIKKFDEKFRSLYSEYVRKLFRTLRDAKRYINGLCSTLPVVEPEIDLHDFLILELIRIFYHSVYDDIWFYRWYYLPPWADGVLTLFSGLSDEQRYEQRIKHIDDITTDEPDKDILLELLMAIFPEVDRVWKKKTLGISYASRDVNEEDRAEGRIAHPDSFPKYFMLKAPRDELSDQLIESTINAWNSSDEKDLPGILKKNYLTFQKEQKLLKFLNKIIIFRESIKPRIARPIIRSLYKNIDIFLQQGDDWLSMREKLVEIFMRLINDRIDKTEIHSTVEEIIKNVEVPNIVVSLVQLCRKERRAQYHNIYENVDSNRLKEIAFARLKTYFIKEKRDIFIEYREKSWEFILYQWGSNWESFDGKGKKEVNGYVLSLFDKNPKYIGFFINHWRDRGDTGRIIKINEMSKVYDLGEIYRRINTHDEEALYFDQKEKEAIMLYGYPLD